jgi:hypothetical protein
MDLFRIRESDLFWRDVEGEIVALDGRTWEYLNVNGSGRLLWEKLVEGATLSDLASLLVATYSIDSGQAESDATAFIEMLRHRELLA